MTNPTPDLQDSFIYKGFTYKVDWYDLVGKELPRLSWRQVYVIGGIDGKVPVVHYATGDDDNLPGGKVEPGESVDECIVREMQEELNCKVLSWRPLGYQAVYGSDGEVSYQLRVSAKLRPIGEFEQDTGGSVIGHSLVVLDKLNEHIKYGAVGDRMVELARQLQTISYEDEVG